MAKNSENLNSVFQNVLLEPWITEESTRSAELNKYIFKVTINATKKDVETAVEGIYKVKVESVNTIKMRRKMRARGRIIGWRSGYKKAIVTLKEGDSIEIFENK